GITPCCKSILPVRARNVDSSFHTNAQHRFKSAHAPIRLFQILIPQWRLGDFCNNICEEETSCTAAIGHCGFRSRLNVACMPEEVPAFLWAETTDGATDPTQKARNGALSCLAYVRVDFADGRLDRVEGWRIRWEVKQRRTRRFDRLPDASHFVGWKIIDDDDFAALEDWDNALPHISKKHRPVHGTLKHERCDHGALPQAGDKRNYFPMPLRRIADQPLSAPTATAQSHHAGACPGLVDKHQ